jgi:2-keto-4-pentenoate hydratase/2-oxohepta-3-ene-1,7-dioic acid hydratase in catechol pathway
MLIPVERKGSVETFDLVPSKIIGIGQNYRAHAVEMGKGIPEEPLMFLKPRSAMIADGAVIERPAGFERVDHEAELGVVIGKRAHRVSKQHALDFVLGYTCVNDVSVRELQKKDGQWARAKGFDTFCPIGPRIVPGRPSESAGLHLGPGRPSESPGLHLGPGLDPTKLRIQARVNGKVRQDSSTSDMIFDVATLISFCSQYMTLEAGDVISTGTPAGVGNLVPGDVCEIEIEGIGVLTNPVIARP